MELTNAGLQLRARAISQSAKELTRLVGVLKATIDRRFPPDAPVDFVLEMLVDQAQKLDEILSSVSK